MMLSKTDILQREKQLGHRDMASRRAYNFQLQGGVRLPFSLKELENDLVLREKDKHLQKKRVAEKLYKKLEADKKRADAKATRRFLRRAKKGETEKADSFEKAQLKKAKGKKYDELKKIVKKKTATPESRMPHVAEALKKIAEAEAEDPPKKRRKKKKK
jgi:hypothetical protein